MKREFVEITDEEWESHSSFKPSRVLKIDSHSQTSKPKLPPPSPPPIESFAYKSDKIVDNLEDDDDDDNEVGPIATTNNRSRRFIIDDDEDEDEEQEQEQGRAGNFVEVYEIKSSSEEEEEEEVVELSEDEIETDDVVGKALQKCAKISAELKRELYGTSSSSVVTACDRYAEVESSSVRIVTQNDIDDACGAEDSDFQPVLKPYQLVGVNFLLLLYRKGIAGAILADEMGLGKTIQAITYLMLLKHLNNDPGPHLIVCPASVLENWERELKKWCPSFSVLQYHGAGRTAYSKELNSLAKAGLPPPFNVLLVCYSLFERHSVQQKDDRKILKRWRWSCVLMDEAHALKDKNSYRWKNLMSVARNANQRLMLTGTPLQNDLHELWSLLEFMMPDLFATEDVDLKKLLNAEDRDLIGRMKSILGPFILRRLKSDVMQQLVPKIQQVEYVIMEKQQEDAYREAIEEYRAVSRARIVKLSNTDLATIVGVLPRQQISNYFVQFRKIANHPLLVRRIYSDDDVVYFARKLHPMGAFGFECTLDRVINEMKSYNDFSIHQKRSSDQLIYYITLAIGLNPDACLSPSLHGICEREAESIHHLFPQCSTNLSLLPKYSKKLLLSYGGTDTRGILSDEHVMLSAKCRTLSELLPSLKKDGHRVLIFSQWTSMLDILEWTLDVIGVTYRRLDGSTQVTERQAIVDAFNNDTSIFACLLSTRAGGQGLNLTGADTVVIHDMDFNPQIDRQAEDRCHRIGQTKPVTIYRLVTKGTVDENVYEIAKRKLILDAAVLESGVEVDNEGDASNKTMGEILSSILIG